MMGNIKNRIHSYFRADSDSRSDASYFLSSGFWLNANSGVTLLLSFGISIAYANFLPKETYGTYQYLLSLFSIISAFTLSGMNAAITRAVARGYEGSLRASLAPQLKWNAVSTFISFGFAGYYLFQGNVVLSLGSLCIAIAVPLITAFNSYAAFLTGKKSFHTLFIYSSLSSVAYYSCMFVTIVYFPSALTLIFVNLFVTALGAVILYAKTIRTFKPAPETDPDLLTYGKHLTVMNTFGTVVGQLDNILVFHFLGPVQLATYSFATLIPEKLSGFLKNLTNSALPRFAEQRFTNVRSKLWKSTLFLGILVLLGIAAYIVIAPVFFGYIYPRYLDAVSYSQLFSLTLFAALGNYVGASLLAHRRIRRLYALNTLTPIVQLVFQVIGILGWGLWGLVIGRVLTTLFFVLLSLPLVWLEPKNTA